jgi:hypothetical protein
MIAILEDSCDGTIERKIYRDSFYELYSVISVKS